MDYNKKTVFIKNASRSKFNENNPKGVASLLRGMGHSLGGFDLYVWGNLPNSAGLSSSASLGVLTATALNAVYDLGLGPVEIALLCQRVENEYMGVNCGIMDQFASAMGRKDHAILLDCSTLEYKYVPLELGDYRLVLANTNSPRKLTDSKYNERRAECEQALSALQTVCKIENLCDLEFNNQFMECCDKVFDSTEDITYKRVYHAVSENHRVKHATKSLINGDLTAFGVAMTESHMSLETFYEVTGHELDSLAQAAHELGTLEGDATHPNAKMLGSRMTGAGFGGCTVSIVHKDSVDEFITKVGKRYTQLTGLNADFYVAEIDDGAREIFD